MRGLRETLAPLSPRRRRWLRFLRELPLDPDRLPAPLDPIGGRDFVICGCPRTGTTLLTAALFQPPRVVTVMEPWDGMRLAPAELFASLRDELDTTGRLRRGRLDLDALAGRGEASWCREGAADRPVEVEPGYLLGVKWPAYWRYLDRLPDSRFVLCLRHPAEVVASFRDAGGRVAQGLQYDTAFNRALNAELLAATDDVALRRVLLFEYVHERLLPHLERPDVLVVRYERWATDPDGLLGDLSTFLGVELAPPPVRIRPSREPVLSERERRLLREHCRTAAALGYDLG